MIRGAGIVGALTLVSRVLGFVRDMMVARLFGSGLFADAFFVAFRIPNLLRSLVAEGALVSAFVPVFAKELNKGKAQAQSAFSSVTGLLLVATTILSLLGIFFASGIVSFFAPGFAPGSEKFALCVLLTRIMLPYIMCVSLIALLNGALNSVQIFGSSALAQVVMNAVLIAGAWVAAYLEARPAVIALSVSVLLGGIAQLVAQIPALRRSGFSLFPSRHILTDTTRQLLTLMLPAIVGATVYQLTVFLNTVMASLLPEGSVSWLFYADRLVQLPIGIFSIALASVLLPTLSHAHVQDDRNLFVSSLMNALRYTSFIIIPVSVGLFCLAEPLIRLLFEHGKFDSFSTTQTTRAVQAYAFGIWSMSCHSMVVRGFIAQHDTKTSTLVGVFSLLCTFILSLLFAGAFIPQTGNMSAFIISAQNALIPPSLALHLGHAGLALASSVSSTAAFLILSVLLHRRLRGLSWSSFAVATGRSAFASAVMASALYYTPSPFNSTLFSLIFYTVLGSGVFVLVSFVLKSPELQETFALFRRLLLRRRRTPRTNL